MIFSQKSGYPSANKVEKRGIFLRHAGPNTLMPEENKLRKGTGKMNDNKDLPVLIVEDDKYMNETLCEVLESEGFKVDSAHSAAEAVKKINNDSVKYNLLILDYNLGNFGGVTGIDIFNIVKEKYMDIKGVMISAYGSKKIKDLAREIGINIFLDKPFLITDLLKALHNINLGYNPERNVNPA